MGLFTRNTMGPDRKTEAVSVAAAVAITSWEDNGDWLNDSQLNTVASHWIYHDGHKASSWMIAKLAMVAGQVARYVLKSEPEAAKRLNSKDLDTQFAGQDVVRGVAYELLTYHKIIK